MSDWRSGAAAEELIREDLLFNGIAALCPDAARRISTSAADGSIIDRRGDVEAPHSIGGG